MLLVLVESYIFHVSSIISYIFLPRCISVSIRLAYPHAQLLLSKIKEASFWLVKHLSVRVHNFFDPNTFLNMDDFVN